MLYQRKSEGNIDSCVTLFLKSQLQPTFFTFNYNPCQQQLIRFGERLFETSTERASRPARSVVG